jgi:hypothetical protein
VKFRYAKDDVDYVDADVDMLIHSSDERRRRETRLSTQGQGDDDEYHEIDGHSHMFLEKG